MTPILPVITPDGSITALPLSTVDDPYLWANPLVGTGWGDDPGRHVMLRRRTIGGSWGNRGIRLDLMMEEQRLDRDQIAPFLLALIAHMEPEMVRTKDDLEPGPFGPAIWDGGRWSHAGGPR